MAENKKYTTIEDYLASLDPQSLEIIQTLRSLIKHSVPKTEELARLLQEAAKLEV